MIVIVDVLLAYLYGRKRPHHLVPWICIPLTILQNGAKVVNHFPHVRIQTVHVDPFMRLHTHRVGVHALPAVTGGHRPGESAVHVLLAALDAHKSRIPVSGFGKTGV